MSNLRRLKKVGSLFLAGLLLFNYPNGHLTSSYADGDSNASLSKCEPLPTKKVYQKEENKYFYAKYFGWNGSIPDGQSPKTEVPDSIEIHGTPDYVNKRIHWRIYYNPSGQEWQKPRIWFAFQNNVKLVGDINIESYFNPSVVYNSQLLGKYSIPYNKWNNYPDQNFYTEFKSGSLKDLSSYQLLYGYGPENNTNNEITHDDSKNSINNIEVGNIYYLLGAGSSNQGSAGAKVSYLFTMDTTMPDNQEEPINVFGGMVSYQTTVWWYKNIQHTFSVAPFDPVVYTYDNSNMKTNDKYLKNNLPINNLKQSEYSTSGLPLANMDEEKRNLIDWIQYLGYPYDNSGIYSNYLTAATEIIAQKEFEKIKRYNRASVAIDSSYNPVKDYYHGTQQAIWNVIAKTTFEPARYEYDKNGKKEVNEINGGQILLDLAKQKYKEHGPLANYLREKGVDISPFVYLNKVGEVASHADLEKGFIKFERSCAKDNEKVELQVTNEDNENNKLTGSKFSLYEGALKTSELSNKQAIKEFTSNDGKVNLSNISTNKYYTLVQNSTPSSEYKKAEPIIFIVNHNYEVEAVGENDTSTTLGIDYSSFPRMKIIPKDYTLERYSVSENLQFDRADSNLSISDPSKLVENAITMINPKLNLDPGEKAGVKINDSKWSILNASGTSEKLTERINKDKTMDLKAKIYYKGLNPFNDYKIVAQLFKGTEKVGDIKTFDLDSSEIKGKVNEILGKSNDSNIDINDALNTINNYNDKMYKDIDLGQYDNTSGDYTLKTLILPKNSNYNSFEDYEKNTDKDLKSNPEFKTIKTAPMTELKYKVTYKYESATSGKELPGELLTKYPLPIDKDIYENGKEINPSSTPVKDSKFDVEGGYWKFEGFSPESITIDKNNVEFVGKWKFEENKKQEKPKNEDRISGNNRVKTAIRTSNKYYDGSDYAIIVRNDLFPDSMTASVLAKKLNCPILLNPVNSLDQDVKKELIRLGVKDIIIVGGRDSISENTLKELANIDNNIERIAGRDRYATSVAVAKRIEKLNGKTSNAVIASGEIFPDALTIGPFAAREQYPILLVKKKEIPNVVENSFKELGIKNTYIAGGKNTISSVVESKLPKVVERIAGLNRYETAMKIAELKFLASKKIFVTTGKNFADALVIGPKAGKMGVPILLADENVKKEVKEFISKMKYEDYIVVGGTNSVSSSLVRYLFNKN